MTRPGTAATILSCLVLAAAGCGGDSAEETGTSGTSGAAGTTAQPGGDGTGPGAREQQGARDQGGSRDSQGGARDGSGGGGGGSEPRVGSQAGDAEARPPRPEAPGGRPPDRLVVEEVTPGGGRVARRGDRVTVHFVGIDYRTGRRFDSSWRRDEPFSFELGAGQTVPGFERGVEGMKVGGRRRLVVPPKLAYGKAGSPPTVAPEATLLFVVDLLEVG